MQKPSATPEPFHTYHQRVSFSREMVVTVAVSSDDTYNVWVTVAAKSLFERVVASLGHSSICQRHGLPLSFYSLDVMMVTARPGRVLHAKLILKPAILHGNQAVLAGTALKIFTRFQDRGSLRLLCGTLNAYYDRSPEKGRYLLPILNASHVPNALNIILYYPLIV